MEKIESQFDFKTLRFAYREVKLFIEAETSSKVISLSTKIEKDLGCTGDDAWDLLEKFVVKYELDASNFDFQKYFLLEGEIAEPMSVLLNLICLPFVLLAATVQLLIFRKINIKDLKFIGSWERKREDLTFADMIVWYLNGKFSLRKDYHILLKS